MKKLMLAFAFVVFTANSATAQLDRLEVAASYGFAPATGIIKDMYEISNESLDFNSFGDADKWGAINANFNLRLTEGFAIGLSYTFSQLSQTAGYEVKGITINKLSNQELSYNSIMLNVKKAWVSTRFITVYSRLAGGITLIKIKGVDDVLSYEESENYIAFQVSPIGVEVGNNLAVFLEGGFGTMGVLQGGVRLRL
jgi:hypothetical protein